MDNNRLAPSAPRRFNLNEFTPAERAIHDAVIEVEKLTADKRLTKAITLLNEARILVADFVDGVPVVPNLYDVVDVGNKLYYEANPDAKSDVPSFVYEQVETANRKRIEAKSNLNLYDWCKLVMEENKKKF